MSGRFGRALLLACSALGLAAGALGVAAPPYEVRLPDPLQENPAGGMSPQAVPSDSIIRLAISQAPFRASRSPAAVVYDPNRTAAAAVAEEPRQPKPRLALAGILWEPEPSAVIEGIPGVEGARLVLRGETVSGLKVRRIERNRVVITGLDTTWSLSVKEPWK